MDADQPSLTLQEWKETSGEVCQDLTEGFLQGYLPEDPLLEHFLGPDTDHEVIQACFTETAIFQSVVEWAAADYRRKNRSTSFLERVLAECELEPAFAAVLQARRDARLSFYRVTGIEVGRSLTVEDVLTGDQFTLWDAAMSDSALPDLVLPLRLMLLGEWHLPMIAGPAEVADEAEQTLKRLEGAGVMLTPEGLREKAEMLGRLWVWKYSNQYVTPA